MEKGKKKSINSITVMRRERNKHFISIWQEAYFSEFSTKTNFKKKMKCQAKRIEENFPRDLKQL